MHGEGTYTEGEYIRRGNIHGGGIYVDTRRGNIHERGIYNGEETYMERRLSRRGEFTQGNGKYTERKLIWKETYVEKKHT